MHKLALEPLVGIQTEEFDALPKPGSLAGIYLSAQKVNQSGLDLAVLLPGSAPAGKDMLIVVDTKAVMCQGTAAADHNVYVQLQQQYAVAVDQLKKAG